MRHKDIIWALGSTIFLVALYATTIPAMVLFGDEGRNIALMAPLVITTATLSLLGPLGFLVWTYSD